MLAHVTASAEKRSVAGTTFYKAVHAFKRRGVLQSLTREKEGCGYTQKNFSATVKIVCNEIIYIDKPRVMTTFTAEVLYLSTHEKYRL